MHALEASIDVWYRKSVPVPDMEVPRGIGPFNEDVFFFLSFIAFSDRVEIIFLPCRLPFLFNRS